MCVSLHYNRPILTDRPTVMHSAKSEVAETAVHCLCSLLEEVPHFNFRLNLMSALVAQLSKRSWNEVRASHFEHSATYADISLL